jgi:hypoxanthine phosphoribosyltransferase
MSNIDYDKDFIQVGNEKFVPMITAEEIAKRVKEIGTEISSDYQGKLPIFIGVLNGSFMFMADLMKEVTIHCEMDFMKLSSYGDEKLSSGNVKMLKELNADISERHLIVVEDIVDSGLSINYMDGLLQQFNPASIKYVSLLVKPKSIKYDVKIDYIGFEITDQFVIGYGLDYAQKYRNLKAIYQLSD